MIEDTLQRYAHQDVPASPLRAADVLVVARHRNRRRVRLLGAATGAAVVLAAFGAVAVLRATGGPAITAAGPGCVAERLAGPSGGAGVPTVTGMDPTGRYVIGVAGSRDTPQAILWTGGTGEVLPPVFAPQAVNAAGTIVGFTGPVRLGEERLQRPVLFDGELVELPLPDGTAGGAAYAVNTHGDVLGTAVRSDRTWVAVRWRTTGTAAVVSAVAGATGLGLTDDGVAVGFGAPDAVALRWAGDGVTTELRVPPGADSATALTAAGDWAAGSADQPSSDNKDDRAAVRWNLRTGAAELIPGIDGRRVSASGTIAGTTGTGAPALWRDGRILTLPPGTAPGGSVAGITDDGDTLAGSLGWAGPANPAGPVDPVTVDRAVPVLWHGC